MRHWVIVPVLLVLAAAVAGGQQPATLTGQAVSAVDGQPLANVRISAENTDPVTPPVLSDAFGRFTLPVAPASRYRIAASKTGFARVEVSLTDLAPLALRLQPGAAIAGRVVDDLGEPVIGAQVRAAAADGGASVTTQTDDRGEYRLPVQPGQPLVVSVMTNGLTPDVQVSGRGTISVRPAFATTYYPSAETRELATRLTLEPGEDRAPIDFMVPTSRSGNQPSSAFGSLPTSIGGSGNLRAVVLGTVEGRVLDASGRGLPNAQVVVVSERAGNRRQLARTDGAGNFTFRNVPDGPLSVRASKPGYALNERRLTAFATDERRESIDFDLTRHAALNGRVIDELGEPIQDARVQLLRVRFEAGRRRLVQAGTDAPRTNDRGEFRVWGLDPGTYVLSVQVGEVGSIDLPGYARTYAPGTTDVANALPVTLAVGQDLLGHDITLVRAPTFRVSGRVLDSAGQPATGGALQLWPVPRPGAAIGVPAGARLDERNGQFEFTGVAPGTYVIQAYRGRRNSTTEGEFGALRVSVADADLGGLVVQKSSGSTIAGSVVVESIDPARRPARAGIELSPIPVDFEASPVSNWATAGIGPDGRFSMAGINGPRRLLVTRVPPGWAVREVRANGIDVTDRPIALGSAAESLADVEVVLTDRVSEVAGRLLDARGRPVRDAAIAVFSADRDRWFPFSRYVRGVRTGDDGRFTVAGLPGDRYYVTVLPEWPEGEGESWRDAAMLDELAARAASVTVTDGQRVSIDLKR
jgi:protocatechuate 3,4-dioxygenase beta subunit